MAKNLTFNLNAKEYSFSPVKIDRSKLYGWTEIAALDINNKECKSLYMDKTGTMLIPKGGFTYGILDNKNSWVNKSDLLAVDNNNNPAPIVPSSFSSPIILDKTVSIEEFLDHSITSIYELSGESPEFIKAISEGPIYTFIFNWKDDYEGDNAFLIESKNKLFVLVGKKLEFKYLGIDQSGFVSEEDETEDVSDEIDFGMM